MNNSSKVATLTDLSVSVEQPDNGASVRCNDHPHTDWFIGVGFRGNPRSYCFNLSELADRPDMETADHTETTKIRKGDRVASLA